MKNTAESFLNSWPDRRENINNINYINHNLLTITTHSFHEKPRNEVETSGSPPASQVELAPTSSKSRPLGHIGTLPRTWKSLKLDLFNNGINNDGSQSLRLKVGIINDSNQVLNLTASLNSKLRYIYYRIEKQKLTEPHWVKVKDTQQYLKKYYPELRGSKFYIGKKENVLDGMVCFLYQEQDIWHAVLIIDEDEYVFKIDQSGSENFRRMNGIYTATYTDSYKLAKFISLKELGF